MRQTSSQFVANAHAALHDAELQPVLNAVALFLPAMRTGVLAQTPDFEAMRDYAVRMKDHTLEHLDSYLADFEARVAERGGQRAPRRHRGRSEPYRHRHLQRRRRATRDQGQVDGRRGDRAERRARGRRVSR